MKRDCGYLNRNGVVHYIHVTGFGFKSLCGKIRFPQDAEIDLSLHQSFDSSWECTICQRMKAKIDYNLSKIVGDRKDKP